MVNLKAIGKNLRRLRLQQGLTLSQLSSMTSVSPVTVHNIEKGLYEPKISTLTDICSALNVPISQFLRPKLRDLFLRIPADPVNFTPKQKRAAKLHSPQIDRIELLGKSETSLKDLDGQAVSLYLIFGRVEVRCGANNAQIMPGDSILLETYQEVIIAARVNSLLIKFTI